MGNDVDLKFRHVLWPTIFGISVVSLCAYTLEMHNLPPMVLALLLMVVISPALGVLTRSGDLREHAIGVTVVCIPMAALWALGGNYFNIAIPFLIWVWQCASWSKKKLPPFRYGIWHGFGIAFSIVPGAILFDSLFQ
tara:strand:- start:1354 stop:1764 length:411 start_codon:yes stop_codon:yes gene_type:complete